MILSQGYVSGCSSMDPKPDVDKGVMMLTGVMMMMMRSVTKAGIMRQDTRLTGMNKRGNSRVRNTIRDNDLTRSEGRVGDK